MVGVAPIHGLGTATTKIPNTIQSFYGEDIERLGVLQLSDALMTRLAGLGGWCVPVRDVLGLLREWRGGDHQLTDAERRALEWRWVWHKLRFGTA